MHTSRRPCQVLIAVVFSLVISLTALPSFAQQSAKGKAAADATTALLQLNSHYQQTPAAQKTQLLTQFRGMAAQRQQLLSSLIQTNPGDVLRVAVPANIRGTMPAAVQAFVEQSVQAQGKLEILHADFGSAAKGITGGKHYYFLNTATERLSLYFSEKAPTHLLTGSLVRATGVKVGSSLALACCTTSTTSLQTVAAALPSTMGAQHTLVVLVNFQDNQTQPYTAASAQNVVFTQVSNWDLENSFQQTWLTGDVAGWFTIPRSSTNCDTSTIASDAQSAASAAGYNLSAYTRLVFAFPQDSACNFWGLGTIGGSPSEAWINGSFQLKVVSHEMGHNLGLYHSHSLNCGTAVVCSSGTLNEYGNWIDTMGNPYSGQFNAFQKERLGWLNSGSMPSITTVTSGGTYQIGPYEAQDSTPKALKVLQSGSSNSYYYVEFRQAIGADSFLAGISNNVLNGLVFDLASPSNANSSDLLDMTPGDSNISNTALATGQSYTDSAAGITVIPLSTSTSGASVQVTFGTGTCLNANPTLSLSPVQSPYVIAGTGVNFNVTVKDNDTPACAPATFNLSDTLPSGWIGVWNTSALSLSPGTSASATLTATSPAGTADGFYNVGVSAANASTSSFSASATATYVIYTPAPVSIAVATAQASYLPGQTVTVTVTMLSGTSPDAGASVTLNITSPTGRTNNQSGTTGSNGMVSFNYKLGKRAAPGTYQVQASTTATGASSIMGANTSFVVQ